MVLQPPLSFPFPQIPFYHHPTCEMPLFNPFNQVSNVEPLFFPAFLYPYQIPETMLNQVNQQETAPTFTTVIHTNPRESPPQTVPIFTTSTSEVTNIPKTPPPRSHTHFSSKSRGKYRHSRDRECNRVNEVNKNGNSGTTRYKIYDI